MKVYVPIAGDLFHVGHRRLLKKARELGDWVIAGVVTDEGMSYKRRPIIPYEERIERIGDYVDAVVPQDGQDPTENLKRIQPDILIHGDDWDEDYPAFQYMRSINKEVVRTEYDKGQSTSMIIKKIKEE